MQYCWIGNGCISEIRNVEDILLEGGKVTLASMVFLL